MPIDTSNPSSGDMRSRLKLIQGGKKALPESREDEYARFQRGINESFAPVGFHEEHLAFSIAHCMWRVQQVRKIEGRIYAAGIPAGATEKQVAEANLNTLMTHSRDLAGWSSYEDRVTALLYSYMRTLIRTQRERRTSEARARKQACRILRQGIAEGNSVDPQREVEKNGFVFSVGDLLSDINHERMLRSTRASAKRTRHPKAS